MVLACGIKDGQDINGIDVNSHLTGGEPSFISIASARCGQQQGEYRCDSAVPIMDCTAWFKPFSMRILSRSSARPATASRR